MKKRQLFVMLALVLSIFVSSCSTDVKSDGAYTIENNMIVFPEPARVEGQKSVLQLSTDSSSAVLSQTKNVTVSSLKNGIRQQRTLQTLFPTPLLSSTQSI